MFQLTITFRGSKPQRHHVLEDPTPGLKARGFEPVFDRTDYLRRADGALVRVSRVRPWVSVEELFSLRYPTENP